MKFFDITFRYLDRGVKFMKKILLLLLICINVGYANTQLIGGYGFSSIETPEIGSSDMSAKNIFAGIESQYSVKENDTLVVSGLLSSNINGGINYLNQLEFQIGFQKKVNFRHYVTVGFQVSHLLTENFDDLDLSGAGFGINFGYKYQIFSRVSFNAQFNSNSYDVANDYNSTSKLNVHTFRTFVSVYP